MATTKITDLTAYTDPVSTDVVPIVDVTSDVTKKVSIADLMENAGSGTEALPGISFDGDPNTGIYRPGADQVAISTNGQGRLFVDASGNVGVGTASPRKTGTGRTAVTLNAPTGQLSILEFTVNEALTGYLYSNASQTTIDATTRPFTVRNSGAERLRIDSTGKLIHIGGGGSYTTPAVQFNGSAPADSLVVDSNGRLGLGTTSPVGKLQVVDGDITVTTNSSFSGFTSNRATTPSNLGFEIGRLNFDAYSTGTTYVTGAKIQAVSDDAWSASSAPSYLTFLTTPSGSTSPSPRMTIKSDGKVGIGTTNVHSRLYVQDSNTGEQLTIRSTSGNSGEAGLRFSIADSSVTTDAFSKGSILFKGDGTTNAIGSITFNINSASNSSNVSSSNERARITSSGQLLVGTTTTRSNIAGTAQDVVFERANIVSQSLVANQNASGGSTLNLCLSRGTAVGSNTIVQSGDIVGTLVFRGNDGTNFLNLGSIKGEVDGTPGSNDMPGRLVFSTNAGSPNTSPTERMRITSGGQVNIGAPEGIGTVGSTDGISFDPVGNFGVCATSNRSVMARRSTNGSVLEFRRDTTGVGSISVTTTATSYNTSSDYRLKENVVNLDGAIIRVKQLAPKRFNFIADANTTVDGFLAHEAQTVVPEAVTGTHNEVDDEGNAVMQGIDQSKLVPLLTAALQEAIAKIETLEAKVAALEAN